MLNKDLKAILNQFPDDSDIHFSDKYEHHIKYVINTDEISVGFNMGSDASYTHKGKIASKSTGVRINKVFINIDRVVK